MPSLRVLHSDCDSKQSSLRDGVEVGRVWFKKRPLSHKEHLLQTIQHLTPERQNPLLRGRLEWGRTSSWHQMLHHPWNSNDPEQKTGDSEHQIKTSHSVDWEEFRGHPPGVSGQPEKGQGRHSQSMPRWSLSCDFLILCMCVCVCASEYLGSYCDNANRLYFFSQRTKIRGQKRHTVYLVP